MDWLFSCVTFVEYLRTTISLDLIRSSCIFFSSRTCQFGAINTLQRSPLIKWALACW